MESPTSSVSTASSSGENFAHSMWNPPGTAFSRADQRRLCTICRRNRLGENSTLLSFCSWSILLQGRCSRFSMVLHRAPLPEETCLLFLTWHHCHSCRFEALDFGNLEFFCSPVRPLYSWIRHHWSLIQRGSDCCGPQLLCFSSMLDLDCVLFSPGSRFGPSPTHLNSSRYAFWNVSPFGVRTSKRLCVHVWFNSACECCTSGPGTIDTFFNVFLPRTLARDALSTRRERSHDLWHWGTVAATFLQHPGRDSQGLRLFPSNNHFLGRDDRRERSGIKARTVGRSSE